MPNKKQTPKQSFASRRNWMKARIMGIHLDKGVMSESEKVIAEKIDQLKKDLLLFWDAESETKFGMKTKYQCWCGKRTSVLRQVLYAGKIINVCKKHHDEDPDGKPINAWMSV